MSKTVFIDTDIILDLLLQREPFFEPALLLFSAIEAKRVKAHVSALIIWNIYYLVEKHASRKQARQNVARLRMLLSIIPVDEKIIDSALQSDFKDFEDAIQYYAARSRGIETIITRNTKDYRSGDIAVVTATEFVRSL